MALLAVRSSWLGRPIDDNVICWVNSEDQSLLQTCVDIYDGLQYKLRRHGIGYHEGAKVRNDLDHALFLVKSAAVSKREYSPEHVMENFLVARQREFYTQVEKTNDYITTKLDAIAAQLRELTKQLNGEC